MESLMSPGSQLNRLIDSLGFPDRLGNIIGAALDRKVANDAGAARDLYNAYSPLSSGSLSSLISGGLAPFGFTGRPYQNYLKRCEEYRNFYHQAGVAPSFNLSNVNQHAGGLLERCTSREDISAVISNLAASLENSGMNPSGLMDPNMGIDQQLAQVLQGMLGPLQKLIQDKLNAMNPSLNPAPVMGKKRKKKGGLKGKLKKVGKGFKKIGKGFKKIGKMAKGITKMGKGLFKGVLKGVQGIFKGGLLKGLTGIFKLGGGLLGGLAGGPLGSNMLGQISGKKGGAKFQQIFGQMSKMFGVVGNIQNGMNQFNLQSLSKMIRI